MRTAMRIYTWVYLRPWCRRVMGGRPEIGRQHFEQALDISGGLNLMVKVMYADQYARLMFERKLHDQLLQDVMAAEVKAPGLR
ncbi:MAG: hypothetical protein CM15mP120_11130 [Pseudomonadota bacterium]|nr:MAG: hypothetical protein CM15mP120_11130 [Pseudomonadota bacterium]